MKEDILEQIVEDYYRMRQYFTITNVKFRPLSSDPDFNSKEDSVHSDIDVIAFNPRKRREDRVVVVSCKSWQSGFRVGAELDAIKNNKRIAGRERWRAYRELVSDKWARALKAKVKELTGCATFKYVVACTSFKDPSNKEKWTKYPEFMKRLTPYLDIITLTDIYGDIIGKTGTTPANSEIGRLIQLLKSSGCITPNKRLHAGAALPRR